MQGTEEDLELLLSPRTIRARAEGIFAMAVEGGTHFEVHPEKLDDVAILVTEVTLKNYPTLDIPFHSRWNHFRAANVNRNADLDSRLAGLSKDERGKAKLDLVIVSVLLDAGAGPAWKYDEASSGTTTARSEGLAVASWNMFVDGLFSSDSSHPFQADAEGLAKFDPAALAAGFQLSNANPMEGFEGRCALLKSLGQALAANPEVFGEEARPGGLLDYFRALAAQSPTGRELRAPQILRALQRGLGSIWPGRITLETSSGSFNLGDAWHYAPFGVGLGVGSLVPFHKLSQWLSYSLFEPLLEAELEITGADDLTGLAEYRNGGLMLDSGLLSLRDESLGAQSHPPNSELIIEWRALTLALLDRLADPVRAKLGKTKEDFPLAKILEGGTWWAGRQLASALRSDGGPPLKLVSDGTVF